MRRRYGGFTLLELLIAVTLLAVLASVVVPAINSAGVHSLEASARVLANDLRLARSLAMQYNSEWTVQFDFPNNAYELVHTGSGNPPPLENRLSGQRSQGGGYRIELDRLGTSTGRSSGVRLERAVLKDSREPVMQVTFGPLGGTGPGRNQETVIWLSERATTSAGRMIQLTVSWVTGQVWIDAPRRYDSSEFQ